MEDKNYLYSLDFVVRDYECDLQGIVNNANYLHYMEHARHQFLLEQNIDFAKLHAEGVDLVVSRIEIDYKQSLKSRDAFTVKLAVYKEGQLRIIFDQEIRKHGTDALVVQAKVTGVCVKAGRPVKPETVPGLAGLKL